MTTLRLTTPIDDAEVQMRRALRVESSNGGSPTREHGSDQRAARRFAQPGDVPVTRLAARKDHPSALALAAAEDALQTERLSREQAEAALAQANATIVMLQTKLAHSEMAHEEALAAERHRSEVPRQAAPGPHEKSGRHDRMAEAAADHGVVQEANEEPVQWWVPGWKGDYGVR